MQSTRNLVPNMSLAKSTPRNKIQRINPVAKLSIPLLLIVYYYVPTCIPLTGPIMLYKSAPKPSFNQYLVLLEHQHGGWVTFTQWGCLYSFSSCTAGMYSAWGCHGICSPCCIIKLAHILTNLGILSNLGILRRAQQILHWGGPRVHVPSKWARSHRVKRRGLKI